MFRLEVIFVALLLSLSSVIADTSLYIPGFEEQPVSVTVVGLGPDGHTTWRIVPGKPTGNVQPAPFPATATMVQGPSDAVVYASFPGFEVSLTRAINSGLANCVGQIDENSMTITTSFQESVKPYLVQGGGSGGSSPSPTPAPSGSGPSTGKDHGSSVMNAVMDVGLFVGGVVAGVATLFLI
ncbi:hypothetical protein BDM02DRAFT_3182321 [Thelephora ganbajun]|uniref:Uncharacterized protein n=1 Tax=Thelephora ganbajun TaxID=370292 RepID=A0ACB6ZW99_THEGA|nr:hypothetical protein BDM02DRAFT_3182321 [Thelephora ganbajun]